MEFCMRFPLRMDEMKWNETEYEWFNWIYNYTLMDHGTKFVVISLLSVFNETYFRSPAVLHVLGTHFFPSFRRALCMCMHFFRFSYGNCINSWLFFLSLLTEQQIFSFFFLNFWKQISSKFLHWNSQNLLEIPIQKCMQEIHFFISVNFSRLLRANFKGFLLFIFFLQNASCVRVHMGGGIQGGCVHVLIYAFILCIVVSLRCSMVHASPWNWPSSYTWR